MIDFCELPLFAVFFLGARLVVKDSDTTCRLLFTGQEPTSESVSPYTKVETLKSITVAGVQGSGLSIKGGKAGMA